MINKSLRSSLWPNRPVPVSPVSVARKGKECFYYSKLDASYLYLKNREVCRPETLYEGNICSYRKYHGINSSVIKGFEILLSVFGTFQNRAPGCDFGVLDSESAQTTTPPRSLKRYLLPRSHFPYLLSFYVFLFEI